MSKSIETKKASRASKILTLVHMLLMVGPFIGYSIVAIINSETQEKVILGMTFVAVLIMTVVAMVNDIVIKSRLWIILLGLYCCLDYILTPLIIIAICQTVDELFIRPMKNDAKTRLISNKAMDKRGL